MEIPFAKYQGAGNDFILIDDRKGVFPLENVSLIAKMCHRHKGIGADGLILWQDSSRADLRMRIFNADGKEAEMCGNGLRCLAHFARRNGLQKDCVQIETQHAVLACSFIGNNVQSLLAPCWSKKEPLQIGTFKVYVAHTGVPHAVVFVDDLASDEFVQEAHKIRYHLCFQPAGVNVNFVKIEKEGTFSLRTYERGVEGETGSCGTGVAASALVASFLYGLGSKLTGISASEEQFSIELLKEGVAISASAHFVFEGNYSWISSHLQEKI